MTEALWKCVSSLRCDGVTGEGGNVRSFSRVLGGGHEFDLDAVDSVHAVDEEDEDEDECDFHPVLYLRHDLILRDEAIFIWLVIGVLDCALHQVVALT